MGTKKLPPIPKTVWSQLGPISVVFVPDLEAKHNAFGMWCYKTRVISLAPDLSLLATWQTLQHECIHVWLWDAGVNLPEVDEERVADAIGTALAAVMLR